MSSTHATFQVPVRFDGYVNVAIPYDIASPDLARVLADRIAIGKVIASLDNPDVPEGCYLDFEDACSEQGIPEDAAEFLWQQAKAVDVCGSWERTNETVSEL